MKYLLMNSLENKIYDCIVIGNGPSGVSAAIYLKRFNLNVMIIGKDNGSLAVNTPIENYYGIDYILGNDLIEKGILQAKRLNIDVLRDEVISIEQGTEHIVITPNQKYLTKSIYLACGRSHNKLKIKHLELFEGKGISYCAICDGFLYRKKRIGIIGDGEYMKSELAILKRFSDDIIVFTDGTEIASDVKVISEKIIEFFGENKLAGIITEHNKYYLDACFIADGTASGISFAKHLGILLNNQDEIIVNDYQTNISGIFAGGDLISGLKQIAKAVSDGACAAVEINKFLRGKENEKPNS